MNSISLLLLAFISLSAASVARRNFGQGRVRIPLSTAEPTDEERQHLAELPHHFRLNDPILTGQLRPLPRRHHNGPLPVRGERKVTAPKQPREPLQREPRSNSKSDSFSASWGSSDEAVYQQAKWDTRRSSMMLRSHGRFGTN